MKSTEMRFLRYLRINIQLIRNDRINYEKIREENIDFIFSHFIFPKTFVKEKYDESYELFKDHEKTFETTMNILAIMEKNIQEPEIQDLQKNLSLCTKIHYDD